MIDTTHTPTSPLRGRLRTTPPRGSDAETSAPPESAPSRPVPRIRLVCDDCGAGFRIGRASVRHVDRLRCKACGGSLSVRAPAAKHTAPTSPTRTPRVTSHVSRYRLSRRPVRRRQQLSPLHVLAFLALIALVVMVISFVRSF